MCRVVGLISVRLVAAGKGDLVRFVCISLALLGAQGRLGPLWEGVIARISQDVYLVPLACLLFAPVGVNVILAVLDRRAVPCTLVDHIRCATDLGRSRGGFVLGVVMP